MRNKAKHNYYHIYNCVNKKFLNVINKFLWKLYHLDQYSDAWPLILTLAHRSVLHRRRRWVWAVPKCLPKWWHMSQYSRWIPLRVCERLDRRWLQWEHWWLCQCSLLPWSHMPRPCGIILLRVPTWAHWWVYGGVWLCTENTAENAMHSHVSFAVYCYLFVYL